MATRAFGMGRQDVGESRLVPLKDSLGNPVTLKKLRGIAPLEYLQGGEEYIREHGWMQGDWGTDGEKVCTLGSLRATSKDTAIRYRQPTHIVINFRAATKALYDSIPANKRTALEQKLMRDDFRYTLSNEDERRELVISAYNDDPATTEADIFTLFSEAKKIASPVPLKVEGEAAEHISHVEPHIQDDWLKWEAEGAILAPVN